MQSITNLFYTLKMQAITFQEPFKVAVETVDIPKIIEPTDAIVKITVCGLCGSDLHGKFF